MKETLRIVKEYELDFYIELAVSAMIDCLNGDVELSTDGYYSCIEGLPPETKEHLRDEILKEVLKRFKD